MSNSQSEVVVHQGGGVTFAGADGVNLFRAMTLKSALGMYAKFGIIPTRGVTASRMLAMAAEYTGKKYKRGQHDVAAADMVIWIDTMKAAMPTTVNGQAV